MPEENQPPMPAQPQVSLAYEFRKRIPTLVLAALTAFATSWWNSQRAQEELQFRMMNVESKATTNAANIGKNSEDIQKMQIEFARSAGKQEEILGGMLEIKAAQKELERSLRR